MERLPWVERKFQFNIPPGWLPNIVSRLDGTTPRLKYYSTLISEEDASKRLDGKWSIKEHIGHLIDLEYLHTGRLEDFKERKPVLRPADMSNKQTEKANHNASSINALIDGFHKKRTTFIELLNDLDDGAYDFSSLHPRLNEMMRPVDIASFTAEHDDHHLASVLKIVDRLNRDLNL